MISYQLNLSLLIRERQWIWCDRKVSGCVKEGGGEEVLHISKQAEKKNKIKIYLLVFKILGLVLPLKGIVHFEIKIWYLSAYPKGIQDVGVFFSSVDPILMFLGQTVLVCQSYNGRYRSLSL